MLNDWAADVCGGTSLSLTVTENGAEIAVGDSGPLITPAGLRVSPDGSDDPEVRDQV
jgi:hypothetical protein